MLYENKFFTLHTTEKVCYNITMSSCSFILSVVHSENSHRRWSVPPVAQSGGVCLSASPGFASGNPSCPLALCCEHSLPGRCACVVPMEEKVCFALQLSQDRGILGKGFSEI